MMEWIMNNWAYIVMAIVAIIYFLTSPSRIEQWLIYAVTMAEKDLGSGTGQIKLRQVYDMFINAYPIFSKIVPFNLFSKWVDNALEFLKKQVESNKNVKEFVDTKKNNI